MRFRLLLLWVAVAAVALAQPLSAATDTRLITVSATVAASAKLTLSVATVTFPDADPDLVLSIPNTEGAITVTAKGKTTTGSFVTLTLQAAGDLASGGDTIAISNVTWTAAGAGFVPGTMSSVTAVPVGSWLNSGSRTGQLSFFLANDWAYPVGNYSIGATYTLTAP
jgi:hypothetical protein